LSPAEPKARVRSPSFSDHYSQARQFFRSQTPLEQAHIASALVFELSKVETEHVRVNMVAHMLNVDEGLARRVAEGLGLDELPAPAQAAQAPMDLPVSDALSIHKKARATLRGRSVGILIAEGSDKTVVEKLQALLKKEGAQVKKVAPRLAGFCWGDGTAARADAQLAGSPSVIFDAVALVVDKEAAKKLAHEAAAVDFVRDAYGHLKAIGVTEDAKALLAAARVHDDQSVVDLDDAQRFVQAAQGRQWDREPKVRSLS
jgi:catalase